MKEPKFKTDGLLLKGLLALSISATPMLTWAGAKPAEASLTTATPKVNAVATTAQRAQATTNTIKGVVKDAHGEPLIGVSVLVKGTGKGSVTNIDGEYTVAADGANPTLVFSYVGYQSQEVAVGNRRVVDVTMQDDSKVLGEVVVTAMGIMRKEKSLTYSTQKVKAEDLVKVQDPNVANTLEGLSPEAMGRGKRLLVDGRNELLGYPGIFALGDQCLMTADPAYPQGHPQMAQVAIQQAVLLAKNLKAREEGREEKTFHYRDLGSMATIGRNRAVAEIGKAKWGGFTAWLLWLVVRLRSILSVRNKVIVLLNWVWNYATYDRSLRLILKRHVPVEPYEARRERLENRDTHVD